MWLALLFEKVLSQGKHITCCVICDRKAVSVEVIICKELSICDRISCWKLVKITFEANS